MIDSQVEAAASLTKLELSALVGLVASVANDGLDTYGLSEREQAAIRRAWKKLAARMEAA